MAGQVYLIGNHTFHWYKIGKSSNATIRVSELGILLPFRIEVVAVWKTNAYHQLEHSLHEAYAENRINGEWFYFTNEEIDHIAEGLSVFSINAASNFSNLEKDYGPEGKVIRIKFKNDVTPEQCEERKQKDMAQKEWLPYCITCHRRVHPNVLLRYKTKKTCA